MAAGSSRGPYLHLTPAEIGKEHGVTKALNYYKEVFCDLPLKETLVRRFKDSYREQLKKRIQTNDADELKELPSKNIVGW